MIVRIQSDQVHTLFRMVGGMETLKNIHLCNYIAVSFCELRTCCLFRISYFRIKWICNNCYRNCLHWEFLGSPVVRTQSFHCCGLSSIPGQGSIISQATWCNQKKEKNLPEKWKLTCNAERLVFSINDFGSIRYYMKRWNLTSINTAFTKIN